MSNSRLNQQFFSIQITKLSKLSILLWHILPRYVLVYFLASYMRDSGDRKARSFCLIPSKMFEMVNGGTQEPIRASETIFNHTPDRLTYTNIPSKRNSFLHGFCFNHQRPKWLVNLFAHCCCHLTLMVSDNPTDTSLLNMSKDCPIDIDFIAMFRW